MSDTRNAQWCKGATRPANPGGACPACGFIGSPTKYGWLRSHKVREVNA